jgi:hypothetical protein
MNAEERNTLSGGPGCIPVVKREGVFSHFGNSVVTERESRVREIQRGGRGRGDGMVDV